MHLNRPKLYKTKLCKYHQERRCKNGELCEYAHDSVEVRAMPNLRKTKLCPRFSQGRCAAGGECKYAHGEQELRATVDFYKTSLCSEWAASGQCVREEACRYAHGAQELRSPGGGVLAAGTTATTLESVVGSVVPSVPPPSAPSSGLSRPSREAATAKPVRGSLDAHGRQAPSTVGAIGPSRAVGGSGLIAFGSCRDPLSPWQSLPLTRVPVSPDKLFPDDNTTDEGYDYGDSQSDGSSSITYLSRPGGQLCTPPGLFGLNGRQQLAA